MVNLLPYEAKDGSTVYINQVEFETSEGVAKVAARLGYSLEEFRRRCTQAQGAPTQNEAVAGSK